MKTKYIAVVMALVMTIALVGCSRKNKTPENSPAPTHTPSVTVPGNQENHNDAFEGGGAGGTEDNRNDDIHSEMPDASPHVSGDGVLDDIGDTAGDLVEGAGDAVRDAGDAIGDAANRAGNAMK